jgi:threonine synthase
MSEVLLEPQLINTGDVDNPVPVSQAMLGGYAPGGELYSFETFPQISIEELEGLQGKSLPEISYFMVDKLMGGTLPPSELKEVIDEAYSPDNFDLDPRDNNIQFTKLHNGTLMADLSAGPTASYKDMPMQPLSRAMSKVQKRLHDLYLTIVTITSGDTGRAVLEGLSVVNNIGTVAIMQKNISPFQRSDMARMHDPGNDMHVLQYKGDFSKLNEVHMEANKHFDLGAMNSVNIGRLIFQIGYEAALYLKAAELADVEIGTPIDISKQTGNFGHGLSSIFAREMGIPWGDIILGNDENDTTYQLFEHGTVVRQGDRETDSSAQNIGNPSNMWRYFLTLFGNDPEKIRRVYDIYENEGRVALSKIGIENQSVYKDVLAARIDAAERTAITREVYEMNGGKIIIDPHTANGVAAIEKLKAEGRLDKKRPKVAVETARAYKFDDITEKRLGVAAGRPTRYIGLEEKYAGLALPEIYNYEDLERYLKEYTQVQSKS